MLLFCCLHVHFCNDFSVAGFLCPFFFSVLSYFFVILHPFFCRAVMNEEFMIRLQGGVARDSVARFAFPVSLEIKKGEHIAVVGPNGAGKSLLVDVLLGRYPLCGGSIEYDFSPSQSNRVYENVKYITFRDTYGSADANYCYQLRWNTHDQDDAIPTLRELLGKVGDEKLLDEVLHMFSIDHLIDKRIVLLSSGELRKFQIAEALLSSPRLLIIDNPFIGLDVATRALLCSVLGQLSARKNLQIVLVLSQLDDVPEFITSVVPVENMSVGAKVSRAEYLSHLDIVLDVAAIKMAQQRVLSLPQKAAAYRSQAGGEVVRLNKVSVKYDERVILKELDWVVEQGDVWALSGENGAGKSTLLSLVCADNLQSYACDIELFGRKRGTGESIWEIKKHIGYVSPEMHRSYLRNIPVIDIVASGLHDSIGLYVSTPPEELAACEWWLETFGISGLRDKSFLKISSGEQRLVLLARAFVKDPSLLILDEPLHGLDTYKRSMARAIIEAFSQRPGKTLVFVSHYENELPNTITKRLFLKRNR